MFVYIGRNRRVFLKGLHTIEVVLLVHCKATAFIKFLPKFSFIRFACTRSKYTTVLTVMTLLG
jgi:hypothetical protein